MQLNSLGACDEEERSLNVQEAGGERQRKAFMLKRECRLNRQAQEQQEKEVAKANLVLKTLHMDST